MSESKIVHLGRYRAARLQVLRQARGGFDVLRLAIDAHDRLKDELFPCDTCGKACSL